MSNNFYVYVHRTADTGRIFYVGKGTKNRAWTKGSRNPHWRNIVNKHGYKVEIVFSLLTEDQAFSLEEEIIQQYGLDQLSNQTLGGISTTGYKHTVTARLVMSKIAKERMNDPEISAAVMSRMEILTTSQDYQWRLAAVAKAHAKVKQYTPQERAIYLALQHAWREDMALVAKHKEKVAVYWESSEGLETKAKLSELAKRQWEDSTYREKMQAATKELWNDQAFKDKLLEIRSTKVVVNRTLILPSLKAFADLYNNGSSITNIMRKATDKGYIGALIKGYLVEIYNPDIHSKAGFDLEVQPLENFELPRQISVKADSQVFLRTYYLALAIGSETPEQTAEWISRKAKENQRAFGYSLSVASIDEVNHEILRRIAECQKQKQ